MREGFFNNRMFEICRKHEENLIFVPDGERKQKRYPKKKKRKESRNLNYLLSIILMKIKAKKCDGLC